MSELALPAHASLRLPPTLRIALRELQGGLRGFYVFIACIALGVMTIASVGSFARGLAEGLAHEGRIILGGDISFSLIQREATPAERAFVASRGTITVTATLRAMARSVEAKSSRNVEEKSAPAAGEQTAARAPRSTALVEIKAIDDAYPLYGSLVTEPAGNLASLLAKHGDAFGTVVDPTMLARLDLKVGSRFSIGAAQFEIRAILTSEPDKIAGGIAFGPRLLISQEALRATALLQPGSLVRWTYRVRLPADASSDTAVQGAIDASRKEFPSAGWEIRTRSNVSPQLERTIEQFTQYLTLVGLTALLVGGVGIANSVKYYLDRKRDVIATLKSMGATGARIFVIYFTEILLLALAGSAIGLLVGAALPFAAAGGFGALVPLPFVPKIFPDQLALALAYGMLTAIAFALWPLGRAHDVPVSALFRGEVLCPR